MPPVPFTKMSGVGNDFIIVDNRAGILNAIGVHLFARRVCTRRMSLGADQLMVIEPPTAGGDFSMRTINPDGTEVKMCGNASRCVARYAHARGLAGARMTIDTPGGPVYAWVAGDEVRVQLQLTSRIERDRAVLADGDRHVAHTVDVSGAPHAVVYLPDGVPPRRATPSIAWGRPSAIMPISRRASTSILSKCWTGTRSGSAPSSAAWRAKRWPAAPGRWRRASSAPCAARWTPPSGCACWGANSASPSSGRATGSTPCSSAAAPGSWSRGWCTPRRGNGARPSRRRAATA